MADSLLTAAKHTANAARLEWSSVQRYYRELQREPAFESGEQVGPDKWLPKSVGRTIWTAHPHYIARLLIALAGASSPSQSREIVQWATTLTPDGLPRQLTEAQSPLELFLAQLLTDPAAAEHVRSVDIFPDQFVEISFDNQPPKHFAIANGLKPQVEGVQRQGHIPGHVFRELNVLVDWRRDGESPIDHGDEEE